MSRFKSLMIAFLMFVSAPGMAGVILDVDANGQLKGASNVEVQGVLWDVEFIDGSFLEVFGDGSNLAATSRYASNLFSQALNQLLEGTDFDLNPEDTFGCSDPLICRIMTPYFVEDDNGIERFRTYYSQNRPTENGHYSYFLGSNPAVTEDFSLDGTYVFADWKVSAVPAPAGIIMLITGLFTLVRRQHRQ